MEEKTVEDILERRRKRTKNMCITTFVLVIVLVLAYFPNSSTVMKWELEENVRVSGHVPDDWEIVGMTAGRLAAYLDYAPDHMDGGLSLYVKTSPLSLGYTFRLGRTVSPNMKCVVEYAELSYQYDERAYASLNQEQVARMELDDGETIEIVELDSEKPFCVVVPGGKTATFYDVNGNEVETWRIGSSESPKSWSQNN